MPSVFIILTQWVNTLSPRAVRGKLTVPLSNHRKYIGKCENAKINR